MSTSRYARGRSQTARRHFALGGRAVLVPLLALLLTVVPAAPVPADTPARSASPTRSPASGGGGLLKEAGAAASRLLGAAADALPQAIATPLYSLAVDVVDQARMPAKWAGDAFAAIAEGLATADAVPDYRSVVLEDTPAVYYRLNEVQGTAAVDASGHNVNGVYASGTVRGVAGAIADDTDKAVRGATATPSMTANAASLPAGDGARTLEAWFRTDVSEGVQFPIVGYANNEILFYRDGNGTRLIYRSLWANEWHNVITAGPAYPLNAGLWHHVAVAFDGTTSVLYVDGVAVGSSASGTGATDVVGATLRAGGIGDVDEVAVYAAALSPDRVAAHWTRGNSAASTCAAWPTSPYAGTVRSDSPILYYRLGEPTSSSRVSYDVAGSCRNGSRDPRTVVGTDGALAGDTDKALHGDRFTPQLTANAGSLPSGFSARTLEVWFRTDQAEGAEFPLVGYANNEILFHKDGNGIWLGYRSLWAGEWRYLISAGPSYPLSDNRWHHAAVTFDGTTSILYVDGVAVGSAGRPYATDVKGAHLYAGGNGDLDEVAVYSTALTPDRIAAHWTAGSSPDPACAATPTSAYATTVGSDKPSLYYRVGEEEPTSRVVHDASGACRNGSRDPRTTEGVAGGIAGETDKALRSTHLTPQLTANAASLPSDHAARTLEAWFRTDQAEGTEFPIVGYANNDLVFHLDGNGTWLAYRSLWAGAWQYLITAGPSYPLNDNHWHHAAVTFDGTTSILYVDGVAVGSAGRPYPAEVKGAHLYAGGKGDIDEVAVYPAALSPDRIAAHWTRGGSASEACVSAPTSPYAVTIRSDRPAQYYRVGETTDSSRVVYDGAGSCRNGSRDPRTMVGVSGAIAGDADKALRATRLTPQLTANAASLPAGQGARSLEAWFRTDLADGAEFPLVGYANNDLVFHLDGNGTWLAYRSLRAGAWQYLITAGPPYPLNDNRWHHAAVTFDGTTSRLYVDGGLVGSAGQPYPAEVTGANLYAGGNDYVDEVAVYRHALSPARVLLHYQQGSATGPFGRALTAREQAGGCSCYGQYAHPVDAGTGNFWETRTDLAIAGRGFPIEVTRTFNSVLAGDDGPLGHGWSFSYGMHLKTNATSGEVTLHQEIGAELTFVRNADGSYSPASPRTQATLAKNDDGTWTVVRQLTQTLRFDGAGRLTSLTDPNGIRTTLASTSGKLATVTDASGRRITVTWTGNRITRISDHSGRGVNYAYDDAGNLKTVTSPDGAATRYTYDAGHRVLSVLDPNQADAETPKPTVNVYDAAGRTVSQTDPLGRKTTFAYGTDMTTITDAKGNVTVEKYWQGLRVAVTRGSGTPQATTTRFSYDPVTLGIVATSHTTAGDPSDHLTSASYDSRGLRTSETDALGRATSYTYNALGDLTSVTAPNPGNVGPARITTSFGYDAKGNLTTETRRLYSTATEFKNSTTTYQHSDPARPDLITAVLDPTGARTGYSYDADGNLTQAENPTGSKITFAYDALGRVTRTVAPRGNVTAGDADRFATTIEYDRASRVTKTTVADGATPIVTTTSYDRNGNQATVKNADGKATSYTYDLAGQLTSVRRPDGSSLASAYWSDGTLARQVDGAGHATSYTSDPLGRTASVTDPLGRVTTYSYDALDNVATKKDPANQTTRFAYDPDGQLRSVTYSDNTTPKATYSRNQVGLPTKLVDGTGTSTWTYDSLGRMVTHTDGPGAMVSYGYDLRGAVTSIGYPALGTVSRVYDASGQLRSVTDWGGRQVSFDYDPDGNLTRIDRPNGVASSYTYDDPGRIRGITHARGATTLAQFSYDRTTAGLLSSTSTTGIAAAAESYSYNTLDQLTKAGAASYAYDKADNLTKNTAGAAQVFDAANEVCWVGATSSTTRSCASPVADATTYRFGARGSRIERKVQGSTPVTTKYGYDQENRLKTISSPTTSARYSYDGEGLRTKKTVGSTTTKFVYDRSAGLPLILEAGSTAYIYGPDGLPVLQVNGSTATYLQADQIGSTRLLSDAAGNNVGSYTFDAYGKQTAKTGTATTSLLFTGEYTDSESGFVWLRARYYDPATAQFLTRDPLVAETRSAYGYVDGNPLNRTDPSGQLSLGGYVSRRLSTVNIAQTARDRFLGYCFGWATGGSRWGTAYLGKQVELLSSPPNRQHVLSPFTIVRVPFDIVASTLNGTPVPDYGSVGWNDVLDVAGVNKVLAPLGKVEEAYTSFNDKVNKFLGYPSLF